jgi:hypothetical protein
MNIISEIAKDSIELNNKSCFRLKKLKRKCEFLLHERWNYWFETSDDLQKTKDNETHATACKNFIEKLNILLNGK